MGFLAAYALEANDNFVKTQSLGESYENISFEIRANEVEGLVRGFLSRTPTFRPRLTRVSRFQGKKWNGFRVMPLN